MFLLERDQPATLVHSASDLVVAAECELRLLHRLDEVLGRVPRQGPTEDEMLARTAELGAAHEARVLDGFLTRFGRSTGTGPGVYEVPAVRTTLDRLAAAHDATLAAIESGADVVYQASFFDGSFHGRADFLVREDAQPGTVPGGDRSGVGRPRYAVYDTKLARRAKVTALLQLAAYADQLRAARVDPTDRVHLVLGTGTLSSHRLDDLLPLLRQRRERMLAVLAQHLSDDGPVAWGDERYRACGRCEVCAAEAEAHRDVLTVGGVYVTQRVRLRAGGLRTIDDLAVAEAAPDGMSAAAFEGLRLQARLQLGLEPGHGAVPVEGGELRFLLHSHSAVDRLPAADEGDIFFDFEGDPLWEEPGRAYGLDYLFGLVVRPGSEETPAPGARTLWRDPVGAPPFVGFWADDLPQERQALIDFVDYVRRRRARYPDLHIYHYAAYEKSHLLSLAARHGVCEEAVDDLLRQGVLVDLYATVRQSLRISGRSRSIKKLEPFYMPQARTGEVTDGGASVVAFATYTAHREAGEVAAADGLRVAITDYNRYDCESTLRLLDWLREARAQVYGPPPESPTSTSPDEPVGGPATGAPSAAETRARREALETEIRGRVAERDAERRDAELAGTGSGERDPDTQALAVLGAAVNYYRREAKPFWQAHFARLEQPPDEWPSARSWFRVERAEVVTGWAPQDGRRALGRVLTLAGRTVEGSELGVGAAVNVLYDPPLPVVLGQPGPGALRVCHSRAEILAIAPDPEDPACTVLTVAERLPSTLPDGLDAGAAVYDHLPMALAVAPGPRRDAQEQAVEDTARAALDAWDSTRRLPRTAVMDLLRRVPPRLTGSGPLPRPGDRAAVGDSAVADPFAEAVYQAALRLDRTTLAVQGPPGAGKTHVGSQVIARLVREHGVRVGVVAQSHAAVENLLLAVVGKAGLPADLVAKKRRADAAGQPGAEVPWADLTNGDLAAFAEAHRATGCVVGGTAWDFADARRWPEEGLDLLVVDEAGQFALADTVAVGRAARSLLLLGDPQQLPQVSQGLHPEGVSRAALAWVAGERDVLPETQGYFLDVSWRMHPDLCAAVSRLSYEGRLTAHPRTARRSLDGVPPGVRTVLVQHSGNVVRSPEESAEVVRQVAAVVGRTWRDDDAPARPLAPSDVIVVAPYNAQVATVRRALDEAGLRGTEVGTVDLFQGREAPVVILTLAASSAQDVTRGTGFLLDRHRINVAVSRGQWCAVVVHSPDLTEFWPHSVRGAEDLGAFLALTGRD